MKYEVNHCYIGDSPELDCGALISILTGLPLWNEGDELGVWARLPERLRKAHGWYGRDFVAVFRDLGFDCSPKFKPFDPATPYPCLVRFGPGPMLLARETVARRQQAGNPNLKPSPWWNVLAYYDGQVYDPSEPKPFALEQFNPDLKITSMLQVWLGAL